MATLASGRGRLVSSTRFHPSLPGWASQPQLLQCCFSGASVGQAIDKRGGSYGAVPFRAVWLTLTTSSWRCRCPAGLLEEEEEEARTRQSALGNEEEEKGARYVVNL